jgi:hypothetical protein
MQSIHQSSIPTDILSQLREEALKASKEDRDPDEMERACADMDRIREEIRAKHGILDIAVPAIRELRDQ